MGVLVWWECHLGERMNEEYRKCITVSICRRMVSLHALTRDIYVHIYSSCLMPPQNCGCVTIGGTSREAVSSNSRTSWQLIWKVSAEQFHVVNKSDISVFSLWCSTGWSSLNQLQSKWNVSTLTLWLFMMIYIYVCSITNMDKILESPTNIPLDVTGESS